MPIYRLLLFRGHRLQKWEEFQATDHIHAIQAASERSRDGLAELWCESTRIAILRPRTNVDAT